jgi:hypothetical protein
MRSKLLESIVLPKSGNALASKTNDGGAAASAVADVSSPTELGCDEHVPSTPAQSANNKAAASFRDVWCEEHRCLDLLEQKKNVLPTCR